jgi:glycosyltransferase involved in cell wall biosynthesis
MTRVLVVTPSYPAPDDPLAGVFVHRQVVHLTRLGVDCRVLAFRPGPPPFPLWLRRRSWLRYYVRRLGWPRAIDGVPVHTVFYRRAWRPGEDVVPAIGRALAAFVARHPAVGRADVVYAHWLWPSAAAALELRRQFGWPVAGIARGSEMHDWHALHPTCRPWVEHVLHSADRVLANCEALRERAGQLVPGCAADIAVVYNGCDPDRFRPADDRAGARSRLGLGPDTRMLLCCADVKPVKGIEELSSAWRTFSARHPDWRLTVVGRVIHHELARVLRRVGRVRLTGRLDAERVLGHLQAADGYVQPSRLEGLANATMEAMAAGLPVITTDTCGQRELVQDQENGWLVPARDPAALTRALEALASDPDRAWRLGRAARHTIETRFSTAAHVERLAAVLAETSTASRART